MSLADPITITINSVPFTLARVETGPGLRAKYQTADESLSVEISHMITNKQRVRSMVKVIQRKIVTDPLSSEQDYDENVETHTWDRPSYGFTLTEIQNQSAGFKTWLDNTLIAKLYGRES